MSTKQVLVITLAAFAGCADTPEDGIDDAFATDGKSDSAITEGSPTALAVLKVVNEADAATLESDALLSATVASQIAKHRAGSDGRLGTADDDRFDTLAELDATPYVGPVTFRKLVAYATKLGYLEPDPFDSTSYCAGPAMTRAQALALFAPGALSTELGAFGGAYRERDCNDVTGCTAWKTTTTSGSQTGLGLIGTDVYFEFSNSPGYACGAIDGRANIDCHPINTLYPNQTPDGPVVGSGKITPSCLSFVRPTMTQMCISCPRHEMQEALFGKF